MYYVEQLRKHGDEIDHIESYDDWEKAYYDYRHCCHAWDHAMPCLKRTARRRGILIQLVGTKPNGDLSVMMTYKV